MEQKSPRKWKMMLVTWLFVYPVINILLAVFSFDTRMATVAENIVTNSNSCAFDGGDSSKASQAIC
jgi:antibiotic biosynthesis monooxygenase (ABM) superfamily enzyme